MGDFGVLEANRYVLDRLDVEVGRFFYPAGAMALGVGQIYGGIRFAVDTGDGHYRTVRGLVYVLTHECDVDPNNERSFNTHVLICPVIRFEEWYQEFSQENTSDYVRSFLALLAARKVSRVMYLPFLGTEQLPYGGLLYLNTITNSLVEAFLHSDARRLGTATSYGIWSIDQVLQRHLFREKAERVPLDQERMGGSEHTPEQPGRR